jgi:type IV pilus assembly protein PilC
MMFSYCALKKDGSAVQTKGEFEDIRDLMDTLLSQDMLLVSYRQWKLPILNKLKTLIRPKVKRMDMIEFCDTLSSMVGSGLPLLDSMESLKETIRVHRLREAIDEVIREIARGESLSGAFSHQSDVFPEMLVFFCSIGEETGTIQNALINTTEYLKKIETMISQMKKALIYPAFVISAMMAVIVFWLFFVLPRLVSTFKEIDVQLPDITTALVHFVEFSKQNWLLYPVAIGCLIGLFIILRRVKRTRMLLNRIAFRLPLVGSLLKYSTLTLIFSNLSLMLRSGVTLTKSLDVLEGIFHNDHIRSVIIRIREETNSGSSLLEAFRVTHFFDAITLKMIGVGEKTGTLDLRLKYLADTYEEKTARYVEIMGKLVEPIAIAIAGGIFVFIVITLIGPVYDLMSKLGGG